MQLNKNSWHYKMWSRSFDRYEGVPANTDLCRYCHRIFWRLLVSGLLIGMILWLSGGLLWLVIYKGLILNTVTTLIVMAVIAVVVAAGIFYYNWLSGKSVLKEPKTLVGKWAQATKQGVCPLVEFTEPTPGDLKSDLH